MCAIPRALTSKELGAKKHGENVGGVAIAVNVVVNVDFLLSRGARVLLLAPHVGSLKRIGC